MPQYSGVWSLQQQMQALTSGQWVTDPLFDYTTLLLQGDAGANGAQNNVFYDTSPNQFAITRNGNTTQGTFSPFSLQPGEWSNFFDGTGDYLTSTVSSVGSSGDLTVEGWVYPTASGVRRTFFFVGSTGTFDLNLFTEITTANVLRFLIRNDSVIDILDISSTATVSANTWSHVAFVLSGTSATIYLNGVSVATGTLSGARTGTFTTSSIGALLSGGATHYFNGYISNLRYVKGTAVYTAAFTPPTAPLTAITNTSLLTCQSNRFIDNSSNAYTITRNGDTSVQAFSPFAPQYQYTASGTGGSGYFDGTGDYLTVTNAAGFQFGTGDFEIAGWFYVPSLASVLVLDARSGGTATPYTVGFDASGLPYMYDGSNAYTGSSGIRINQWNHVVWTRLSGTLRIFVNGVSVYSAANSATFTGGGTNLTICSIVGGGSLNVTGYVSGFRIIKGSGVSSVTVPTAPPTAVTNTNLLLNFTNAGILDGTMKNNLETVGNASVSTSVVKYGSGSMYFDGSGDGLVSPISKLFDFGNGNFTVEFWANCVSTSGQGYFVSVWEDSGGSDSNSSWLIRLNSGTIITHFMQGGATYNTLTSPTISTNTWFHFAWVRNGNTQTMYINGTAVATGSVSGAMNSVIRQFRVGYQGAATNYLNGYLDDMRITTGIARYTQNFIPPSVALPRQ